jgi:hypothetical protein
MVGSYTILSKGVLRPEGSPMEAMAGRSGSYLASNYAGTSYRVSSYRLPLL